MTQLATRKETAKRLDDIASNYQLEAATAAPFEKSLILAQAIEDLRGLLTADVMKPILALMNTDLGFRTDRDPRIKKNGAAMVPYSADEVRDALIDAALRGFYPVNNEFNIISGRFYAAKNGVRRKVTQWKGLTDFKDTYGVPRTLNGGAIVVAKASWKLNGTADSLEREIPVKVNEFMGTDAILGKAERKLLKSVLDRISGEITPEGEIGEEPLNVTGTASEAPVRGLRASLAAEPEKAADPLPKELTVADPAEQAPQAQPEGQTAEPATTLDKLLVLFRDMDLKEKAILDCLKPLNRAKEHWTRLAHLPEDGRVWLLENLDAVLSGTAEAKS